MSEKPCFVETQIETAERRISAHRHQCPVLPSPPENEATDCTQDNANQTGSKEKNHNRHIVRFVKGRVL